MTAEDVQETAERPQKIDKWDQNAVRLALDDAVKKTVLDLGYVENFHLVDSRLIICTIAVLFSLLALVWDFLYPYPQSRPLLIVCVCSYFFLMCVLTLHLNFFEKNIFLVAHQTDPVGTEPDIVWTFSSTMLKYDSNYTLTVTVKDDLSAEPRTVSSTKSVGDFIDVDGVVHMETIEPLVTQLKASIAPSKKKE